jgi:hypothetical protein
MSLSLTPLCREVEVQGQKDQDVLVCALGGFEKNDEKPKHIKFSFNILVIGGPIFALWSATIEIAFDFDLRRFTQVSAVSREKKQERGQERIEVR